MWVPESDRLPLDPQCDFDRIDETIRDQGTFPYEALILDEDLPATPLLTAVRSKQLLYKGGRGIINKHRRVAVAHAAHLFETTTDETLLNWCAAHRYVLLTCNQKDFKWLHQTHQHAGLIICVDQGYPAANPDGCARKLDSIFANHSYANFVNRLFAIRP